MAESVSRQSEANPGIWLASWVSKIRVGGGEGGSRSRMQWATGHTARAQPCHTFEFYTQTKRWYLASTQDVYWSGQDQ